MNLLQISFSKVWRGHEQKIIYLYEEFEQKQYFENQYIIAAKDSPLWEQAHDKKMQVTALEYTSEYNLKTAKAIASFIQKNNIDIVFIHNSSAHTQCVLAKLFFGAKVPMVLCRTLLRRVDTNLLRKWKYNYAGIERIICVSKEVKDILKPAVKNTDKMTVVGSVTDIHKFQKTQKNGLLHTQYNIPKDYKLIGNIAAFTGFKDLFTWVDTVEELVKRNTLKAHYVLIGEGELEEEIQAYIQQKNLQNHILLTGFRKDIPEILPELDLFLFTSDNEPTGGVLLEAYACHVPIVATRAGGIPDVVLDGKTGLLAEVKNPMDLADKVEQLMHDCSLQNTFTKNGYEYLEQNFTKEVIAEKMYHQLLEVYNEYNAQ